jgi:hypothetical protein
MFRLHLSRRLLAQVAAPLVAALVLGLGLTILPGMSFSLAARAAESPDCACEEVGPFAAPNPGLAPAYTRRADNLATSPSGEYEIVVTQTTGTLYRAGDRNRPLLVLPLPGTDRRWGFSPDEDRFLTWTLGAGQTIAWELYDLSGASGKLIASASGVTASSINFAFSSNGERLLVGAVQGNNEQRLSVYSALTGGKPLATDTAPIIFPASDPGGVGGDSGAPSAPRNVVAEVPKKTTNIDITWDEPYYQGDGAITDYELLVDPYAPEGATTQNVGDRHVRLTGYTPGIKYTFQLRIVNRWGKKSAPVTVTAKIPLPKPAPTPTPTQTRPGLAPDDAPDTSQPAPAASQPAPDIEQDARDEPTTQPAPAPSTEAPTPTPSHSAAAEPAPTAPPAPEPGDEGTTGAEPTELGTAPVVTAALGMSRTVGEVHAASDLPDPGTTSGWGFSPDARFLLIADHDGTRPRVKMFDLESGKTSPVFTRSITQPSARWWFSPCGGALGILQLSPTWSGTYTLIDNATGKQLAETTRQAKASYGFSVESVADSVRYYTWADGVGRALATVADCGDPVPPPTPPAAPTAVSATAAIGRAVVSWQHPATDIDSFEVTPYRDGVAQTPVTVDGRQRTAVLGSGTDVLPVGAYSFRVAAVGSGGRSAESAPSAAVRVLSTALCGNVGGSDDPVSGSAEGTPTASGVTASFTYSVSGRTVLFRTTSGPSMPASVLDAGRGSEVSYPAGGGTRLQTIVYPTWGDYLASVVATGEDGAVSVATAVIHITPQEAPANDAYAKATELTGTSGSFDVETRWTTCEEGEPGGDDATLTQWFTYRAPDDGALILSDSYLQVNAYAGQALVELEPVGTRFTKFPYSNLVIPIEEGDITSLQVFASARSEDPRPFQGAWRFVSRPDNDDIAKAAVIDPAVSAAFGADLGAATVEPGEPGTCEDCGAQAASSTWYRWTAVSDTYLWFHSPTNGVAMELFAADASQPFGVSEIDPIWKVKRNEFGLRQEPGRTYYVRASLSATAMALYRETAYESSTQTAPANDLIRDATVITGASGQIDGSNKGGYVEAIPERPASARTRSSMVWYEWRASSTGPVSFAVDATRDQLAQPEALVFLPGEGGDDPRLIAPATLPLPEDWTTPRTTFIATKGQRYLVAVTGVWTSAYSGATEGDFTLRWGRATVPGAPTGIHVDDVPHTSAVELDWTLPDDGNADVLGYQVTAEPALPGGTVVDIGVAQRRARIYGLEPGVNYDLRLAAVNSVGVGRTGAVGTVRSDSALTIDPMRIAVEPGAAVTGQLVARGGTEPYSFIAADSPSWLRVDRASGAVSGTAPEDAATAVMEVKVTDASGNEARRVVIVQVGEPAPLPIDADIPAPTPSGWYDGQTTVVLTATDIGTLAASTSSRTATPVNAAVADVPALVPVNWVLEGAQSGSGTTTAEATITISAEGETTLRYWSDDPALARTLTIRIDRTAPSIVVTKPGEGEVYQTDEVPNPEFSCEDPLSGIASCEVVPTAALAPLVPDDVRAITVRAVDHVGNASVLTRTYRVVQPGPTPEEPRSPLPSPLVSERGDASSGPAPRVRANLAESGAGSTPVAAGGALILLGIAVAAASRLARRRTSPRE